MESKQDINDFEQALRTDLRQYLLSLDKVDERLPEAPDIEGLWPKIGESYLPDGMREFADYPTVSLGCFPPKTLEESVHKESGRIIDVYIILSNGGNIARNNQIISIPQPIS